MLDNDRATIGDNRPPPYDPDVLAQFEATAADFLRVTKQWLSLESIETEEHAGQVTDQIDGLRGLWKKVESARKAAKKPHDDAGNEVQAAFTPLLTKLQKAADALKPKLAAYASEKARRQEEAKRKVEDEARRQAEEAEKARREAEASGDIGAQVEAEEAALAAEKAQKDAARKVDTGVKSASGAGKTMSLRKVKEVTITNINVLFMALREEPEVQETLHRIATRRVRAAGYDKGERLPGINVDIREVMA